MTKGVEQIILDIKKKSKIPCFQGKRDHITTVDDRALYSRADGQSVPLVLDQPPETDLLKMINQLETVFEWNKVAKINLGKTEVEGFIRTLHDVDM